MEQDVILMRLARGGHVRRGQEGQQSSGVPHRKRQARPTQLLARVRDVFAAAREERRGTEDERDDSAKAALRSKGPGTSSRYR